MVEISKNKIVAELPITPQLTQPMGVLHGGINVVLAESITGWGSQANVDSSTQGCVGLEINANHLRPGFVGDTLVGTGIPIFIGSRNQVWGVSISYITKLLSFTINMM